MSGFTVPHNPLKGGCWAEECMANYRRMRGRIFERRRIGRFKYPFKYLCSFFPCVVRFDFSRADAIDHANLLNALESLLNYSHSNLDSRYDFVDVKDIERQAPLKFSRRWLVN